MKKLFALMMAVLLICACAVTVSAEEAKYSTAGELYEAWCEELPDYICGVWSTDGGYHNLTFGIQNNEAGNAGKQEMLALVEDDSSLTFVYQQFSRNYLLQIQEEIYVYFEKDLGLVSTGLDEYNNCIELGILEERKNNADTKNMIGELRRTYGDAVSVEYTGAIYAATVGENKALYAQPLLFLTVGIAAVFLSFTVLFVGKRRHMMLLGTNNGTVVSAGASPTAKDVEDMVKKSDYSIPENLDQRVMRRIEKCE